MACLASGPTAGSRCRSAALSIAGEADVPLGSADGSLPSVRSLLLLVPWPTQTERSVAGWPMNGSAPKHLTGPPAGARRRARVTSRCHRVAQDTCRCCRVVRDACHCRRMGRAARWPGRRPVASEAWRSLNAVQLGPTMRDIALSGDPMPRRVGCLTSLQLSALI